MCCVRTTRKPKEQNIKIEGFIVLAYTHPEGMASCSTVWGITLQIDAGDSRSSRMHSATDTGVNSTSRIVSYLQRIQKQQTPLNTLTTQ